MAFFIGKNLLRVTSVALFYARNLAERRNMDNVFDTANYQDSEPDVLVCGDRWAWTRSDITEAYPTATYTLKYRFSPLDLGTAWEVVAGKVDSAHVVEVSQATTTAYASSECEWKAIIVRDSDSEEVTVDTGHITIKPEVGAPDGTTTSWVYQVLSAIRATILGTASNEQSSYSIGGRALSRRTPGELLELEREFSKRWEAEKAAINRKAGRSTPGRVLVKMSA